MKYEEFLWSKTHSSSLNGFAPEWMPGFLFDFQKAIVDWSVRKGRAAIFADCGLGKTPMQLTWAENVVRKTNGRVILLTPIAVGLQAVKEAEKFGIEAHRSTDGKLHPGINIVNYERLHLFNANDFAGAVCDESSILKNYNGVRRSQITEFMRKMSYRLLCTATAAPNDYIELGSSSESLGELGYTDMLTRFFRNAQNTVRPMRYTGYGSPRGSRPEEERTDKWRFKGHTEVPFWRWVGSWARAIRKPSDLGFDDSRFMLPSLIEKSYVVTSSRLPSGHLFPLPAVGLAEQREERRRTMTERCEKAASLAAAHPSSVAWCHLNPEGDLLERLIPDCVQVSGADSEEEKEEKITAFTSGQVKRLVTKGKVCGWGMNWQHCAHTVTFPSHSFEQYYQTVRRFWRFGQTQTVHSDIVTSEGEASVLENLQRKSKATDQMFASLVEHMNNALSLDRSNKFIEKERIPLWL